MAHLAVVVPGIMGSELRLGDELIWPGPFRSLVFAFDRMNELLREDLVATDVIRNYSISRQYGALLSDLQRCGFEERGSQQTLWPFAYDWRKDNALSAVQLADLLDQALAQHRGESEVSLVAHSMGGLVCRYYLESGLFSERPAFSAVRRLITLGTPHRGAPLALTAALGSERRLFLSAQQVQQIARDPRYPSLYQLLPPPREPFAWDRKRALESIDIYDPVAAEALGLSLAGVDAAKRFHSSLSLQRKPEHVRYFFFTGSRQPTLTAVLLTATSGKWDVTRVESEDAGDGTVPIWSSALTGVQGRVVGGEHGSIYRNDDLRSTLSSLLGGPVLLAPGQRGVEVSLRERVVEPCSPVHVALTFTEAVAELDGELCTERAELSEEGALKAFVAVGRPVPVRYAGPMAQGLNVVMEAPGRAGIFRVAYYARTQTRPLGSDELFVQA